MDQSYFPIVQALRESLCPTLSKEMRLKNHQFLMELKGNPNCGDVITKLLLDERAQIEEPVLILSLSILHDWIKSWWERVQLNDQLQIRNVFSTLLMSSSIDNYSTNYQNKFSSILAELCERLYPQYWPSMVDDFVNIWLEGQSQQKQEIILKTLGFLYTDCSDTDFLGQLSSTRRQEIITGLTLSQEKLLGLSYEYLQFHLKTAVTTSDAASLRCVRVVMELLQNMSAVVPGDDFFPPQHNFILCYLEILSLPAQFPAEVKLVCAENIHKLFNKTKISTEIVLMVFCVFSEKPPLALPDDDFNSLLLARHYSTALVHFLSQNFDVVSELLKTGKLVDTHLDAWFQEIFILLRTQSRRAAGEILVDLCKVVKHDDILRYGHFEVLVGSMLEVYFERTIRPDFLDSDDTEEWFDIEFDNIEEWTLFHSSMISQVISLASTCASKSFGRVVSFLESKFRSLCELECYYATQGNGEKLASLTKHYHLFQLLFHAVCNNISGNLQKERVDGCFLLYDLIMRWDPKSMAIMRQKLKCVSSSALLLKFCDTQHVFGAFEAIFRHMEVFLATEDGNFVGKMRYDNVYNDWAECFSNMIQQCLQHIITTQSFTLALLEQIKSILARTNNTSIHATMREVLIILSNSMHDKSMKESLLQFAFYDFGKELKGCLVEYYPHVNSLFENVVGTFLYPTGTDPKVISMELRENNARALLEKLVKIKDYFTTFNMIFHNLDLSLVSATLEEMNKVSTEESVSKLDLLSSAFPVVIACMEFIDNGCLLLQQIQHLWHPDKVKLFLANYLWCKTNAIPGVKLFYGLTSNELDKHVKTQVAEESTNGSGALEMIRDEVRLLLTVVCKALATLCKKQIFHLLLYLSELPTSGTQNQAVLNLQTWCKSIQEKLTDIFVGWTMHFEHTHYGIVIKHFLEQFYLAMPATIRSTRNTVIPAVIRWFAGRLAQFFNSAIIRLTVAYDTTEALHVGNDSNVAMLIQKDAWNDSDEKFYCYLLYQRDFLIFNVVSEELATIAQESMIGDIHRSISDLISLVMANRGPLKVIFPSNTSTIPPETITTLKKQLKRRFELHQVFFNIHIPEILQVEDGNRCATVITDSGLRSAFVSCFTTAMKFPDSTACRTLLPLIPSLLLYSLQDTSLVITVCREIFPQVLYILLRSERWSVGMEMDCIECLLDVYRTYILGTAETAAESSNQPTASHQKTNMFGWTSIEPNRSSSSSVGTSENKINNILQVSSHATPQQPLCNIPREELTKTGLSSPQQLFELENRLFQQKSKKKQRDILKDFLSTWVKSVHGKDELFMAGCNLATKGPKIPDLQLKIARPATQAQKNYDNVDLSSLFG